MVQRGIERFEGFDFGRCEESPRDLDRVAHGAMLLDIDAELAIARECEQQPFAGMREVESQDARGGLMLDFGLAELTLDE